MSQKRRYISLGFLLGCLGIGVLVAVLVVGAAAYKFITYPSSGGLPSGDKPPAQVSIGSPVRGAQLTAGESLLVNATAVGPNAFLSMELWVDGELGGVQAAPSGGVRPFSTFFYWLPKEPGIHSLIATAIDAEEQKAISAQVIVFVTPEEGRGEVLTTAQDDSPFVLPAPGGVGYAPPNPPGAGDSVAPADDWSGSPGDWITSLTADEKPAAPELAVSAGQCGTTLSIHDLSNNEEGFAVYRQTINSPVWQRIATLSSQSQNNWLTYTDTLPGAITYYVSAFNSQGEAASNLALVNIDPTHCPAESGELTAITVEVTKLMPELAAEMSYCYKSTDAVNWTRWPQFGFLTPGEGGAITGGPVEQLLPTGFDGQPAIQTMDLFLECWGWQGGTLRFLGNFVIGGINPQIPSTQLVAGEGLSAEVVVDAVNVLDQTEFYPMGPSDLGSKFAQDDGLTAELLVHPEIPGVLLWRTTDYQKCEEHLLNYDPTASTLAWCRNPYPEYGNSQPYLLWFHDGSWSIFDCIGDEATCKSYEELLALAEQTNGEVGIEITAVSSIGSYSWSVIMPHPPMHIVPPLACTGEIEFSVRLWYQPGRISPYAVESDQYPVVGGPETGIYYGPPSNWVQVPCPPSYEDRTKSIQHLDVTFKTLEVTALDDGDDDAYVVDMSYFEDVEVYGYFRVLAPAMGVEVPCSGLFCDPGETETRYERRLLNIADWESDDDFCAEGEYGCLHTLGGGRFHYDLSSMYMCQATTNRRCRYFDNDTAYLYNNNTIRVFVKHGDALGLGVKLIDYDEASANDTVCHGAVMTPSKSLTEWANTHNEPHAIVTPKTDSGQCTVQIEINAVTP